MLQVTTRRFEFNAGTIQDLVADPARHRVYFSVANEVVVLSSDTYLVQQQLFVGSLPKGLKLSADGQKLYVALGEGGSLVVVDLNTLDFTTIEVATQMGTSYLSDVLEVQPGVVLLSGQQLVTVDLNNNNQVTVVANGVNAGSDARLRASLDGRFVYVGSPSPLYEYMKLDNTTPALPVIVQSGLVSGGPDHFALSADGNRIMSAGGEIYDTSHFGLISNAWENGIIGETSDDSSILQQSGGTVWTLFDGTFTPSALITSDCAPSFVLDGVVSAGFAGQWLINVSDGSLCVFSTTAPDSPPGVDATRTLNIYPPQVAVNTLETVVGNFPYDMAADFAHDRFYVTLPQDQKVVIVAAAEGGVVGSIALPGQPGHVILSADGVHMYVGLLDSGSVAIVDLTTLSVTQTLDLSVLLGQAATGALLERAPGDLLVGGPVANAHGQLPSYAVELNPADITTAHRIGNLQGYCGPNFAMSPDGNFLYVDNAACTSLVEKRDLTASGLPVVMTSNLNNPLSVLGANFSNDGTRLYIEGGDVVDALTLRAIAYMVGGTPFFSADQSLLYSILDTGMETWNPQTQQRLALVSGNCQSYSDWGSARNLMWPDRKHWAILSVGDIGDPGSVCVMDSVPP